MRRNSERSSDRSERSDRSEGHIEKKKKKTKKQPLPEAREHARLDDSTRTHNHFTGLSASNKDKKEEEPKDEWEENKVCMQGILTSSWFDVAIACVIAMNAVCVGIEQSFQLEGRDTMGLQVLDSVFLVIYLVEFGMRVFAYGIWQAMRSSWMQFDLLIIILGVVSSWILEPIAGNSIDGMGQVMVLRTLRLLRLGRTVRLFRIFSRIHEFWILVRGFLNGLGLMLCTGIILTVFIYVFSCLGVELVTKHPFNESDEAFREHVQRYFPNLAVTMMTLLRFAVLDNTSEVYTLLVLQDPWLFIYFGAITLVISLVAFNLFSAVIYNSTLELGAKESDAARKAQEDEWAQLLWDLKQMFLRMDTDGSGRLSREEVQNIHERDMARLSAALNMHSPMNIFNALDVDGSGELSITEFFDGALDICLNVDQDKNAVHVKRMEKQIETMHWRLKDLFSTQHELDVRVTKVLNIMEAQKVSGSVFGGSASNIGSMPGGISPTGGSGMGSFSQEFEYKEIVNELSSRLQNIWHESVRQSMSLTLQQVELVAAQAQSQASSKLKNPKSQSKLKKTLGMDSGVSESESIPESVGSSKSSASRGGHSVLSDGVRSGRPGTKAKPKSKHRKSDRSDPPEFTGFDLTAASLREQASGKLMSMSQISPRTVDSNSTTKSQNVVV
eukprot:TRINITY_DN109667_c0_g1_i1.p1 TRINITY_DN109667_c0_g1~~TRINITY_DN109667_c0_g1_i1.p1  ORF type:complete len:670 (+),score=113.23 TRINITY_DN109667_c0_g1_i1:70-2079(+)